MTVDASDGWDLASGVGLTATEAAAARAVAGRKPGALIDDPFAEALVRAVGVEFFVDLAKTTVEDAESGFALPRLVDFVAVRTKFFDGFLTAAQRAGIRQTVILGAGLDSRAYRMDWAPLTTVYEVDQRAVLDFKTATMDKAGIPPRAVHKSIPADLAEDWERSLRAGGFTPELPTAWCAEGLLPYLAPADVDTLLDTITSLSAVGSRLAGDSAVDIAGLVARIGSSRGFSDRASDVKVDINAPDTSATPTSPGVAEHLERCGWTTVSVTAPERFESYQLLELADELPIYQRIQLVTASATAPKTARRRGR